MDYLNGSVHYLNTYTNHFLFYHVSILLQEQLLDHQLQYLMLYTLDMYKIPFYQNTRKVLIIIIRNLVFICITNYRSNRGKLYMIRSVVNIYELYLQIYKFPQKNFFTKKKEIKIIRSFFVMKNR